MFQNSDYSQLFYNGHVLALNDDDDMTYVEFGLRFFKK